jgi:hypothetical protein
MAKFNIPVQSRCRIGSLELKKPPALQVVMFEWLCLDGCCVDWLSALPCAENPVGGAEIVGEKPPPLAVDSRRSGFSLFLSGSAAGAAPTLALVCMLDDSPAPRKRQLGEPRQMCATQVSSFA